MPGGLISGWLIMPGGLVSGWCCFALDSMPSGLVSEWCCFPLDFVVCHLVCDPGGWCVACGLFWDVSRCSRSLDSLRKSLVPRWG